VDRRDAPAGSRVDGTDGLKAICVGLGDCAFSKLQESINQIIHVNQLQRRRRIMDLNGQIACDLMAKSSDRRVVMRTAPFAKHVGQTEQVQHVAMFCGQGAQGSLCGLLGLAIGIGARGLRG
jgi:hypothetical protein